MLCQIQASIRKNLAQDAMLSGAPYQAIYIEFLSTLAVWTIVILKEKMLCSQDPGVVNNDGEIRTQAQRWPVRRMVATDA